MYVFINKTYRIFNHYTVIQVLHPNKTQKCPKKNQEHPKSPHFREKTQKCPILRKKEKKTQISPFNQSKSTIHPPIPQKDIIPARNDTRIVQVVTSTRAQTQE